MTVTELKIRSHSVVIGMFVSKLDRPWLETPFPLQGFLVESPTQVEKLQELCVFVYVDIHLGEAPSPGLVIHEVQSAERAAALEEIQSLRERSYTQTTDLREEMQEATQTYKQLNGEISEVMSDLRAGKKLDFDRLKDGVNAMLESIMRNPDAFACLVDLKSKDVYAYRHALGTSVWAATFGRHLGMPKTAIEQLAQGGLLLDVGKARLPLNVLNETGPLSEADMELMRTHVAYSVEIVSQSKGISDRVVEMIQTHHERFDGSGYPAGLQGGDIPMFGRLAGIADTYDALTSQRLYAEPMSPHGAVNLLYEWRGVDFQSELVEQFIQTVGIFPTGTLVELNSGEVGVIISLNGMRRLQPRVMLLLNNEKKPLPEFQEVDLMMQAELGNTSLQIKRGLPRGAYDIDTDDLFL